MSLALGTKLGVFEIVGSLGAGGMGEVYRARDGKRFVMVRGADPQGAREIVLVQHWFEELKRSCRAGERCWTSHCGRQAMGLDLLRCAG